MRRRATTCGNGRRGIPRVSRVYAGPYNGYGKGMGIVGVTFAYWSSAASGFGARDHIGRLRKGPVLKVARMRPVRSR